MGVYSISVKSTAAGAAAASQGAAGGSGPSPYRDGVIDVLVMENVFYDRQISRCAQRLAILHPALRKHPHPDALSTLLPRMQQAWRNC